MFGFKLVRESELQNLRGKIVSQEERFRSISKQDLREIEGLKNRIKQRDNLIADLSKQSLIGLTEAQAKKVISSAFSRIFTHKKNVFEALETAKKNVLGD